MFFCLKLDFSLHQGNTVPTSNYEIKAERDTFSPVQITHFFQISLAEYALYS